MVWQPKLVQASVQRPQSSSQGHIKPGSRTLNLLCLKNTLLGSPTTDLWGCARQCCCEWLIVVELFAYLGGSYVAYQAVSKRSSAALGSKSHKSCWSHRGVHPSTRSALQPLPTWHGVSKENNRQSSLRTLSLSPYQLYGIGSQF